MQRPQFAELLASRRHQLRLSIPQAARVLRMRESVLEAFEVGDFDHLPALGYAQGMVASYARYLGLDPRRITELYEREHAEYVAGVTGRAPTGLARLADEPGHDGPASAASQARSTTTGLALARTSGSGYGAPSGYSAQGAYNPRGSYGSSYSSSYGSSADRRYTTRNPNEYDDRARRQQAGRARRARDAYGDDYQRGRGAASGTSRARSSRTGSRYGDDIQTRRVDSGQYRDDLRFGSDARPYRPSSTRAGREGSRNISAPVRPNVRRQSPNRDRNRDPRNRGRRNEPQRSGIAGVIDSIASDPRRAAVVLSALLVVLLVVILTFSIRSCASSKVDNSKVNVVTAVTSEAASTSATTTSAAEQQALSEAAAKKAASAAAAATQETKVTVSVADGATTWVEITCDGEQKVAESITGSWSQEYSPKKSLEIRVGDPSVVTVEKNGERQTFSGKSAGTSTLTIEGTDPEAATTASTTSSSDSGSSDSSEGDASGE